MTTQGTALSPEAQRVLDALPADASTVGNVSLRRRLEMNEDEYRRAVEELDDLDLVRHGRGRGGSLALNNAVGRPVASTTSTEVASARRASRPAARRASIDDASDEGSDAVSHYLLQGPGGLFERIRQHVATKQGQGQVFERLIKAFLREDPVFAARFSQVWLWSEWPGRNHHPDTGIDLVAEERDGGLCAVQCKFYGDSPTISKGDIDGFLSASGKKPFTARLFVSSTEHWGKNAEATIADQHVPVQRLGVAELEASPFDWARFDPEHPDQLPRRSPNEARPHQVAAIADVKAGLAEHSKGVLVMACGTGKTLTALRLAEDMVPAGGAVLFCVPSISLLSQTLRAWSSDAKRPLHAMAVCSDAQVTKDSEDIHIYDLALPATTNPEALADRFELAKQQAQGQKNPLLVVFSTYQSLDRVVEAQERGLAHFDLIVADEAHRTTGAFDTGKTYANFTLVHDDQHLHGHHRLYMTATPRIYAERAKRKAETEQITVCSMDDETLYGPVLHRLGFGKAVDDGLLSDYRVVVLMVDEGFASRAAREPLTSHDVDLALGDAARLVGCWRGLSKVGVDDGFDTDPAPMRRAVAFSTTIAASRTVAKTLPRVVDGAKELGLSGVSCATDHVDGSMGALVRDQALSWLRENPPADSCRVLSNARCLSEGVDVPALDAVIFMQPRKSQIDVVQAVGRVMRRAEGKRYGYVVIPVAVPAGADPEAVLDDNDRYQVVWQVLQALRAHDDRFDAEVNKLDLQTGRSPRIQVVGVGGDGHESDRTNTQGQLGLAWEGLEDKVYARVVKHVGSRRYWEDWADDVARIAEAHVTRITTALEQNPDVRGAFDRYLASLHSTINPQVTEDEAVDMLAQHLVTEPVFEALFGDSEFAAKNPVSMAMAEVLTVMHEQEAIEKERAELADFYRSVRTRAEGIDNLAGRQHIVKDLYEVFFRKAFPKAAERLGIVYTPVEIVDFMLNSVNHVLGEEFGRHLGEEGVHVLDPFTGTGTFIARLLPMLGQGERDRAYRELLHANEIVLLAYYIAAVNIEQTYHALRGDGPYEPFPGIVLTDTFQLGEGRGEMLPEFLRPNSERARRQQELPITVVVANPPYSVGQGSENDNNKNLKYPNLDEKIRSTYAARSSAGLKRNLYDSYVRAIRWATDRIGDRGIVCYVSNGAFIDSGSADGLRKTLANEFTAIWCLNLRGNQRTQGEQSRREGGKVFGQGSRTPVAITLLVKNPNRDVPAKIEYHDIGEYLSREEKLAKLADFRQLARVPWQQIVPNAAGDWINQRSELFDTFTPLGDKGGNVDNGMFTRYTLGVVTNRDAWAYNFSLDELLANMRLTIDAYNEERERFQRKLPFRTRRATVEEVDAFIARDARMISWTRSLKQDFRMDRQSALDSSAAVQSMYRPFCKQWLYFNRQWNEQVQLMPSVFPSKEEPNQVIAVSGVGAGAGYSVLISDVIPCLTLPGAGNAVQCFPRYYYTKPEDDGTNISMLGSAEVYEQHDAISPRTLDRYREHFGDQVSPDDVFHYVYGLLHSPEYTTRFAAELGKMIPRIPMVDGFWEFVRAGEDLARWHLGYETVDPWQLDGLPDDGAMTRELRVEKMRFASKADHSSIVVNPYVTLSDIPEEAHRYQVNGRSALEWLIDRYQVKTDKASGIVNDPNAWGEEHGDPRYIVDLVARIVRVSVETVRIVENLPALGV